MMALIFAKLITSINTISLDSAPMRVALKSVISVVDSLIDIFVVLKHLLENCLILILESLLMILTCVYFPKNVRFNKKNYKKIPTKFLMLGNISNKQLL